MKNIVFILFAGLVLTFGSCKKESALRSTSEHDLTLHGVGESSTVKDRISGINKRFDTFLLFTDTVEREGGWRIFIPNYEVYGQPPGTTVYRYDLFQSDEHKMQLMDDLDLFMGDLISDPKEFSKALLIVDKIVSYTYNSTQKRYVADTKKYGSLHFRGSSVWNVSESLLSAGDKKQIRQEVYSFVTDYLTYKLPITDPAFFEGFQNLSKQNYGQAIAATTINDAFLWTNGFLSYTRAGNKFPLFATDRSDYIKAYMGSSEDKWRTKYKDYPLVLKKLEEVGKIIKEMGFNWKVEK